PSIRKAVAQAIDFNEYNKAVNGGVGETVDSLFTSNSPFYANTPANPPFDAAAAQKAFDAYAASTGGPVKFTLSAAVTRRTNAEFIQGQLLKYKNINVDLSIYANEQSTNITTSGNFDATLSGYIFDDPEPTLYDSYFSTSPRNFSRYSNPDVDAALTTG